MDTNTGPTSTFAFMQAMPGARHRLIITRNTRILLEGASTLYRQRRRMNQRNLRNSILQGSHYVQEVLNEMAGDTRLRQLTGLSR